MPKPNPSTVPKVGVQVYFTHEAYQQMVVECGHCGCAMSGFIRSAVIKEISSRRMLRKQAADHSVLVGQLSLEENSGG